MRRMLVRSLVVAGTVVGACTVVTAMSGPAWAAEAHTDTSGVCVASCTPAFRPGWVDNPVE